jgi:asparagine synthase (glutamine-hydrolysing)
MPRRAHRFNRLVWSRGFRLAIREATGNVGRLVSTPPTHSSGDNALPAYARVRPLNRDFVRRIALEEEVARLGRSGLPAHATAREIHWADIASGNWAYILEAFEKAAGAQELELRYPFFDRRLVEFCIALPPGQRLQGGFTRSILRRAMDGILPPEVQWRTDKGNLSPGVQLKLLEFERPTLEALLVDGPREIADYLDIDAVRTTYQRYAANPVASDRDAFTLILAATLGLWLQQAGSGEATGLKVTQ